MGQRRRRHGARTTDGGTTWQPRPVPGAEALDFRDIDAVDERTAYVLSIGPGDASRIYKTSDAGEHWTLQFPNADPKAFYDAMAFRDARHGFAFSDSVDNTFVILQTSDGGSQLDPHRAIRSAAALARRRRLRRKRHERRGAARTSCGSPRPLRAS